MDLLLIYKNKLTQIINFHIRKLKTGLINYVTILDLMKDSITNGGIGSHYKELTMVIEKVTHTTNKLMFVIDQAIQIEISNQLYLIFKLYSLYRTSILLIYLV